MYECPVPYADCVGTKALGEPASRVIKIHQTRKEMHRCIAAWMKARGYEQMPNREFHKAGCPVVMVSKQPGFRLRWGKEKTRYQTKILNRPIKSL